MTLAIGYQGENFAAILTDSMEFRPGPTNSSLPIAVPDGEKFFWSGDRLMYVVSGRVPSVACDIDPALGIPNAARTLFNWMRSCPQDVDPSNGRGYDVLVAGGAKGTVPELCFMGRGSPLRRAAPGDVFFIGACSPRARKLGLESNQGELSTNAAGELLLTFAGRIVEDLYRQYGCDGPDDFAIKWPGLVLTVAPPFHIALITQDNTYRGSYHLEMSNR